MPTRCNRGFYCRSYCLLNMFRAPLCPSSGAQEYYTVVAACAFRAVVFKLLVWCGAEGYVSGLQDAAASMELWARNCREFCRKWRLPRHFWVLLHAVNLRHGTDGFTSPPKEGALRIFSPEKSDGFGRVWTRELGYQRSARSPPDHRSRWISELGTWIKHVNNPHVFLMWNIQSYYIRIKEIQ